MPPKILFQPFLLQKLIKYPKLAKNLIQNMPKHEYSKQYCMHDPSSDVS